MPLIHRDRILGPHPQNRWGVSAAHSARFLKSISTEEWMLLLGFILINFGLCIAPLKQAFFHHHSPKDYPTWFQVGRAVLDNKGLYPPDLSSSRYNFFYPPAIATLFYAPLSLAGPMGMMLLLLGLSVFSYFFSIIISVYLTTGRWTGERWMVYALPGLFSVPFVWDIYFLGQLNLTLLGLMLLGFVALEEKKPGLAGILFAVSTAAKAFPITIIFYLLWRRFYTAAVSMLIALFIILVLLPAPFRGFDRNLQEISTWADHMLLHNTGATLANQPDRGYRYGNQTLVSVISRLTRPLPVGRPADGNLTVNFVSVSSRTAFFVAFAIAAALCLAFVAAIPPRRFLTRRILALEGSIVLLFIVIFSPKAGSYYYCWTIPGFTFAIAELTRGQSSPARRRWIAVGLVASLSVFATALTQVFSRVAQGMGATMWGGVLLSLVLIAILWEEKKLPAPCSPRNDETLSPHDSNLRSLAAVQRNHTGSSVISFQEGK